LARRRREELAGLVALGEALRAAQADALAGADAATLRQAARTRREAVTGLTQAALALLAERGPGGETHQAAIAARLEAASLDPEAAAAVTSGRLTSELAPLSGFGEPGFDDVDGPLALDGPAPETHRADATEAEGALARAAAESADAASAASALSARAAQLWRDVKDAEAVVAALERDVDEAKRRLSDVARDAAAAERAADQAEAAAAEAASRLQAARKRIGQPDRGP
jgi:hypothetical protein